MTFPEISNFNDIHSFIEGKPFYNAYSKRGKEYGPHYYIIGKAGEDKLTTPKRHIISKGSTNMSALVLKMFKYSNGNMDEFHIHWKKVYKNSKGYYIKDKSDGNLYLNEFNSE